jgi:aldehyde:ferredoxin oxidoreductase
LTGQAGSDQQAWMEGVQMKVKYGYMGKLLFVDLTNRKIYEEELSETVARQFVGGYGIGARVIIERMKAGADPLGPDNIFGIGTGPLTLSGVVSTCRFTTMGKSPLTGYWGDANSGGNFANSLKGSGYDIVFFEGRAEHPVYVVIDNGKVEIKDARHLWGKDTTFTEELIRQENGNKNLKVAVIGQGGERLSRIAAVINDRGRAAARSGLGAVMGSKNLKAVACSGTMKPETFDKPRLPIMMREMLKAVKEKPTGMFFGLSHTGTPGAMVMHMSEHDVPIKNWGGNNVEDFPESKWNSVAWDGMEKYVKKKYACTGCPVGCGSILDMKSEKYSVRDGHKPEYESLAAFGPLCLNDNMESLIYANELCNLYGLDTISAGATVAFAIECFENGVISREEADGLELRWGNSDAAIELLKKMCTREGIGDILADGARWAAQKIGRGSEKYAMHSGGEMLAMHDPRCYPGWGATYVSDSVPGRHTRGGTAFAEHGGVNEIVYPALGVPTKLDRYDTKDKGKCHAIVAGWQHWVNASGVCLFAVDSMPMAFLDYMNAVTGWDLTWQEIAQTGKRIATLLHTFNLREGFKPSDFKLPERVNGNPPMKVGGLKDVTIDSEGLKRQFYEAMGFDPITGVVSAETAKELGVDNILSAQRV